MKPEVEKRKWRDKHVLRMCESTVMHYPISFIFSSLDFLHPEFSGYLRRKKIWVIEKDPSRRINKMSNFFVYVSFIQKKRKSETSFFTSTTFFFCVFFCVFAFSQAMAFILYFFVVDIYYFFAKFVFFSPLFWWITKFSYLTFFLRNPSCYGNGNYNGE